jgi:uncharacterized protein (DUF302 family)
MKPRFHKFIAATFASALLLTAGAAFAGAKSGQAMSHSPAMNTGDGVLRVKSAYGVEETISRLKADIAAKGIQFFDQIDQQKLASGAGIKLNPSVLLIFGNPPLGTQFLTANPYSGLDWPVRMLVLEDADGQVWIAWNDFTYIAHRHHITDRDQQFAMATMVSASIAAAAEAGK